VDLTTTGVEKILETSYVREKHSPKYTDVTGKLDTFIPQVFVDFFVTDEVHVLIRVEGCPKHLSDAYGISPQSGSYGLSPGAKEFVPGTPHMPVPKSKSTHNRAAPVFVSRVLPGMIPDQEVVHPDVSEPIFFPPRIQDLEDFLPFKGAGWNTWSSRKRERIVPANKFRFKVLGDVPVPDKWNKTYPVDLLLAMRSFFRKLTKEVVAVFLHIPEAEGEKEIGIGDYVEENILIRLAVSSGEYLYRCNENGFQISPVSIQGKRKRSKKKANVTFKAPVMQKKPSPLKTYQIEKTSEHIIKPNVQEMRLGDRRKALIDIKSFFKKFKIILNKLTSENIHVMTFETRCLETE
jgi:hypothetical protein